MRIPGMLITGYFFTVLASFTFSNPVQKDPVALGKKIYESNCKSCHKLFDEFTGGPLYGTLERVPNKKWLYDFMNNPNVMFEIDPYAACLLKKYRSKMTTFRMTAKEIDAIYRYVYSEARKRKEVWNNKKYFESCK